MRVALWHLRCFVGLGLVFTALSELWFYPIADVAGLFELTLYYAVAAYVGVLIVLRAGAGGALGLYCAALFLGFVVEAVPVFEFYSAPPMTILWTSMAWHGLVSGLIGIWLYRLSAARGVFSFFCANTALGVFLGLWGAYFWGADPEGIRYAQQLPWAFGLFVVGQLVLPTARVPEAPPLWPLIAGAANIAASYAVPALWLFFPVSLLLPVMIGLTCWAARGAQADAPLWCDVPAWRFGVAVVLPATAYLVFEANFGAVWVAEMNVVAIVLLGPVSIGLFALCLWRAARV